MKRFRSELKPRHRLRYRLCRAVGAVSGQRGIPATVIDRFEDYLGGHPERGGVRLLRPSYEVAASPLRIDSDAVSEEFRRDAAGEQPAFRLVTLNDVHLRSRSMLLLTPDKDAVFLESDRTRDNLEYTIVRECCRSYRNTSRDGACFLAFDRWGYHYFYHWMVDTLCRFLALEALPPAVRVIMPRKTRPYMLRAMELMGVDADRFEYFDDEEWSLPVCHFAARPYRNLFPSVREVVQVRDRLLANLPDRSGPKRRLYVSRAQCADRIPVNEAELTAFLEQNGFERYFPENDSLDDQIVAFHNAEAVIGSFGSGLTGLMFCRPQTPVMVFYDHDYFDACIHVLGNCVELEMFGLGYDHGESIAFARLESFLEILSS